MGNNTNTKSFVNHPRYGNQPCQSEYEFSDSEIKRAHWRYQSVKFFPETAIPADITKQNYAVYPRSIYVDIEVQCVLCKRSFIFFAQEQKYWFETLSFYVDAHCTRCFDCRKKVQEVSKLFAKYNELILKEERTDQESKKLKNVSLELLQLGYITKKQKIDSLK